MIGQASAVFEPVVVRLQADVGAFLGLKQRLLAARLLPVPPEQQAALQRAYAAQLDLEAQLPGVLQAGARLQAGQLNFADSIRAGGFLTAMELHTRRTQDLLGALPAPPPTTVNWGKVLLWAGGAAAAFWAIRSGSSGLFWAGLAVGGYMIWRNWTPAGAQP